MEYKNISGVMCTFNGALYLEEQLMSIINQTYPIYEIIIQDDCSTDSSNIVFQMFEKRYTCIHVYRNETRKGINANFFSAMSRAKGDFIAISDQDDIWELDKIENQMNSIQDNWLSSGFSKPFADNESIYFDNRIPNLNLERLIYIASSTPGHTLLFRKELLSKVPMMDFILYDHLMTITAAALGKLSFCNKILVNHREHSSSATFTLPVMKRGKSTKNIKNIISSLLRTFILYLKLHSKIRSYFIDMCCLLNEFPNQDCNVYAKKIAYYNSQKGLFSYLNIIYLCVKRRTRLFYVEEPDNFLTFLRALYFPISSSDYFRYMSKPD